jgi:hypothetical protein
VNKKLKKLHPNDLVAAVSIGYDLAIGIPALIYGATWFGILSIIGGVAIVFGFDWWEDRIYRQGATLSWLDFMHMRDLMAHGQNYEAVLFVLRKAYNMDEAEIKRLTPEEMDTLLQNLKVKQGGSA